MENDGFRERKSATALYFCRFEGESDIISENISV